MDCVEYECYFLKEEELALLLAGLGIPKLYGLFSEHRSSQLTKEETNRIMVGLYQKGLIDWKGQEVIVRRPLSDMLTIFMHSRQCITVYSTLERKAVRCCYAADHQVVMVERSQREKGTLRLSQFSKTEWIRQIRELADISESVLEPKENSDAPITKKWLQEPLDYLENEEVHLVLSIGNSRTAEEYRRLIIQESGLYTYIIMQKKDSCRVELYQKELFGDILEDWEKEEQI